MPGRQAAAAAVRSAGASAPSMTLVWGEEGGGSAKPTVERHVQAEIRATISTSPLVR
jgi:hypothetical protein